MTSDVDNSDIQSLAIRFPGSVTESLEYSESVLIQEKGNAGRI
jgi:hypothetical protein